MITWPITYTDFLGNERTEKFRFNLSEAELMQWELSKKGTLSEHIDRIKETIDIPELSALYCELIDRAYGEMDADGRAFRKNPEILANFKSTNAYSELYMELATNQESGGKFIAGIVSDKLRKLMEQGVADGKTELPSATEINAN